MASWMFPAFHRQSVSRLKHATEESTPASSSVFCIGNIPADRAEGDIFTLLEHETGTRPERVRLVRDRTTGASQQLAFVDCKNGSSAASAVKSLRTTNTVLDNHTLHAALAPDDLHDLSAPQHAYDWACELPTCAAVNFSRRHECHKCGQKRPLKPQLVENTKSAQHGKPAGALKIGSPSSGVMIAGLEPQTDERSLTLAVTPIAPVKDLRLVKHKHSLESRGFAFCDLFSVDDAKKVLNALNGAHIDVQSTPLRLMFTRDGKQAGRHYEDPNNPDDAAVADADAAPADDWKYSYEESNSARSSDHAADASKQPEQPKHALDAWEPAAFSETDLQESIEMHLTAAADAAQEDTREPSDARDVQKRLERHQQLLHNQEEQTLSEEDAQEGHKQAPSSTYIWDENSQTYYEQTSGYYYEPWRQLWYEPWNGIWYYVDATSQQLVPFGTCTQQQQQHGAPYAAQPGTSASDSLMVHTTEHQQPSCRCYQQWQVKRSGSKNNAESQPVGNKRKRAGGAPAKNAGIGSHVPQKAQTKAGVIDGQKLYEERPGEQLVAGQAAPGAVRGGRVRNKRQ